MLGDRAHGTLGDDVKGHADVTLVLRQQRVGLREEVEQRGAVAPARVAVTHGVLLDCGRESHHFEGIELVALGVDGEAALVDTDDAGHLADARCRALADAKGSGGGVALGFAAHVKPASRSFRERYADGLRFPQMNSLGINQYNIINTTKKQGLTLQIDCFIEGYKALVH